MLYKFVWLGKKSRFRTIILQQGKEGGLAFPDVVRYYQAALIESKFGGARGLFDNFLALGAACLIFGSAYNSPCLLRNRRALLMSSIWDCWTQEHGQ